MISSVKRILRDICTIAGGSTLQSIELFGDKYDGKCRERERRVSVQQEWLQGVLKVCESLDL